MQNQNKTATIILWGLVFACLAATVVVNQLYSQVALIWRLLFVLTGLVLALFFFFKTDLGRQSKGFLLEARSEVRKVVWPTKQETLQSATMVLVMVFVVGVFLWAVDAVLFKLVASITGYGV